MNSIAGKRQALINKLFPSGIPRLWCPLLTHYRPDGGIDFDRMHVHFNYVVPWVKGFLIPGSTGDGWELTEDETLEVADFAVQQARTRAISLLLGVLKADVETMKRTISSMIKMLQENPTGKEDAGQILQANHVCGFTICPPRGKSLTQHQIEAGLSAVLDMGMPIALYQLPQVTENEVAPETFERLVQKYSNLFLFKDSSGQDSVATSDVYKGGVFLVRGAEGNYAHWLTGTGGCYDGFLLSTANCFSQNLSSLIESLEKNDQKRAGGISERLTAIVSEVFALVQPLPYGNPFTNANKVIDHFFAFGPSANTIEGPILHEKIRIPHDVIQATGAILTQYNLMPERGYLE
ncbi:MAG: dihydrodipicolinate synthase family protein [Syntrophales bacterium]|jgi:dihydrodipicolinate synthase/N-acetylneuraminate lyase